MLDAESQEKSLEGAEKQGDGLREIFELFTRKREFFFRREMFLSTTCGNIGTWSARCGRDWIIERDFGAGS